MTWLVVVVLAILTVALYPIVRDFIRRRRGAQPAYVEGLQNALDGRVSEAIARLKEAVNHDTENVDAYIRLGDLFMQQGDVDRALKVHENLALRRNMSPFDEKKVYQALVRDYVKTDRKVKAIAILEEMLHLDKADIASRERLTELYIETGSWEKCEAVLKEFGKNPAHKQSAARLYTEFGRAYGKANPSGALAYFDAALKLDPGWVQARVSLGDLQLAQGDTEAAIKNWSQVLDFVPEKNALVRERLERAYFEVGRFDDITRLYEGLLRKVPNDAGLAVALADICQKKEDLSAAIGLLERFRSKSGESVLPQVALASLYLDKGDAARAKALLVEVITRLRAKPV